MRYFATDNPYIRSFAVRSAVIPLLVALFITLICTGIVLPNKTHAQEPWDPYAQYLPGETPVIKRQLRGVWLSTVINLDWPLATTKAIANDAERIAKSKEELITLLDKAVELNMNAVFFQVSPEGDALYKSNVVPWSRYLTGTFGKDPGFDPLEFAITEAHKRNLELHAWFNPYRIAMNIGDEMRATLNVSKSVYKEHPEWIRTSGGRIVLDPGIPEARKWVVSRIMEVVTAYDIDGIHLDDYFYTESYFGELKDTPTYNLYNKGQFGDMKDWRRNNTYLLIKDLSSSIRSAKPWVKFGVSPSAIWANIKDGQPEGTDTVTDYTNYNRDFADTRKWVIDELLDYIAPQVYFSFGYAKASYGDIATWWANICKGRKVQLYIGQAFYKFNDNSDPYFTGDNAVPELQRQLRFNAMKPEISGTIMFRMRNLYDVNKQVLVEALKTDLWSKITLVPIMPWKGGIPPELPVQGGALCAAFPNGTGLKLSWSDNPANTLSGVPLGSSRTAYYAIYRFNAGEKGDIVSDSSAAKLIGTVRKTGAARQEFIDTAYTAPAPGQTENVFYVVSALDRLHHESAGLVISRSLSQYFPDIPSSYSWAAGAVDRLYQKEVIKGDSNGLFNPAQNTKRGDFVLMTVRALNLSAVFDSNFSDVPIHSYYYDAVGITKVLGIAKGDGLRFDPDGNITRQDMLVIIVRALEAAGKQLEKAGTQTAEYLAPFTDAGLISSYAREPVATLVKAGLVQGSGGKIDPRSNATRAELAVLLDRVISQL